MALSAQGFARPRPTGRVTARHVTALIDRLAQFQIDTISIVERAHYMPVYSRLGPFDKALLDAASSRAPRRLVEYWGHAASLVDVELWPALQWRMRANAEKPWASYTRVLDQHQGLDEMVLAEVRRRGPLTARQIEYEQERRRDHWGWNWSAVKHVLEHQFTIGQVTSAARTPSFERLYDLPERVVPDRLAQAPALSREEAHRVLVARAARALGVASLGCLADYFRLGRAETLSAVTDLVATGELAPVVVDGWSRPLWCWHEARVPRRVDARTLVSPFDSLIFERRRTEELFGLRYRIEIYVPEAKRQHGYYVYPFLLGERFVARVDLKADRARGVLIVRAAWGEPGIDASDADVARALAAELGELARWTGCAQVRVEPRGDFAATLAAAVAEAVVASAPPASPSAY